MDRGLVLILCLVGVATYFAWHVETSLRRLAEKNAEILKDIQKLRSDLADTKSLILTVAERTRAPLADYLDET
jgi:demethoxyubiquinone hydroxylase (CLK1/Coq7/Cat5 family)